MAKLVLGLVSSIFLISACASTEPELVQWPHSCKPGNEVGYIYVIVNKKSHKVTVDGMEYRPGLINEHQYDMSKNCTQVKVVISHPKSKKGLELFGKLAIEANKGPGTISSFNND